MTDGGKKSKPSIKHVIILVHGIRTRAEWQPALREELTDEGVAIALTNYGYFDVFRFLIPLPYFKRRAIARIWDNIKDVQMMYPGAKISILAHSFGTFIISEIMRKRWEFKAHRIVFCGSVVKFDFPFHEISNRFDHPLINEIGSCDPWPVLAENVTWGYGSAGTYGFRVPRVYDRWHPKFKHSDFLTREFCTKYWVPFFRNGEIISTGKSEVRSAFWIGLISYLKLKYFIPLLFGITAGAAVAIIKGENSATMQLGEKTYQGRSIWFGSVQNIPSEDVDVFVLSVYSTYKDTKSSPFINFYPNPFTEPRFDAVVRLRKCHELKLSAFCTDGATSRPVSFYFEFRIDQRDFFITKDVSFCHLVVANSPSLPGVELDTYYLGAEFQKEMSLDKYTFAFPADRDTAEKNLRLIDQYDYLRVRCEMMDGKKVAFNFGKDGSGKTEFQTAKHNWGFN